MELTDYDQRELGRLVAEGYTSGTLDGEENGESYRISWSISTEKFNTSSDE